MATLVLDNLPPELLSQIELLAQQNHCSVPQQAIALLQQSLPPSSPPLEFLISPDTDPKWTERRQAVPLTLKNIRSRRRVNPHDYHLPDSTQLLREDRER